MRSPIGSIKKNRAKLVRRGGGISHITVFRRLSKEFNQKSYKPAKKTRLTAAMKVKGLEFASNHQHWTAEQWVRVLFCDESPSNSLWFERGSSVDQQQTAKRFDERCTIPTVELPPNQMVWGVMSRNGIAAVSFLPPGTTLNEPKYVQMLSEKLKLHQQVHNCQIFMQDGTPCHCSKVAKNLLDSNNVELFKGPGNSTDSNPIDNLWTNMKN